MIVRMAMTLEQKEDLKYVLLTIVVIYSLLIVSLVHSI